MSMCRKITCRVARPLVIFLLTGGFFAAGLVPSWIDSSGNRLYAVTSTSACGTDLRLLVISADGTEVALSAIRWTLDYLGTPYTLYIATQNPGGLSQTMLEQGCRALFNGVILTTASLGYSADQGQTWQSALTPLEWQTLQQYEAVHRVRQVSWFTFPTPDIGFQWGTAIDTSQSPVTVQLTFIGQLVFPYLNSATPIQIGTGGNKKSYSYPVYSPNPLQIQNAYTYLAKPLDASTTPLAVDAKGNAVAAIHRFADGRESLALTFDSNPNLLHNQLFSYGVINWVNKGLFLGERHVYMSAQIDDLFIPDTRWTAQTACGTNLNDTGVELRIAGADLKSVIAWQERLRQYPNTPNLRLTMAFNGSGADVRDGLTRTAKNDQDKLYWVNHTFDHPNLDEVDAQTATDQITLNNDIASTLGFSRYSIENLVTPEVSGLTNPLMLHAAYSTGVRYVVTDTSKPGYSNPSPNVGIYNSIEPGIYMIPRRPNNLFFNVATPSDWTAEYNCLYEGFWGRKLSYDDILEKESQNLLSYMLLGDIDPWMFHQTNLKLYDGAHTLITDLLDRTLAKYNGYFRLPLLSPAMDDVGRRMKEREVFNTADVVATLGSTSLTLAAATDVTVPITGLRIAGAEQYGFQSIARVQVPAGGSVTIPLP